MAVVGAGSAAQVVHLPILMRLPGVSVTGLVETNQVKAETIAERFSIPAIAGSVGELPEAEALDAVLVCSPNDAHEPAVLSALELGAHVLCERPLATSSASAARMLAEAARRERQLMVAMNQRFRYDLRTIRRFIASGELGDVFFLRSTWLNRSSRRPRSGWRRDPGRGGCGVLMDLGTQAIDVALWLLGFPRVLRVASRLHRPDDVDDTAAALFAVEGGPTMSVEVSWELLDDRDQHGVTVLGTKGSASSAPFRVRTTMETGLADVTPPLERSGADLYTDSYRQEWAEFLRFVRGEKPMCLPADQVELLRVVEACYRSAEEGREVEV
ncbi:MAG: Gfo/Idh/MocA family protein [Gemmatimonadota bacterium]